MIDPLTITHEPTARAHADMIFHGEIAAVRAFYRVAGAIAAVATVVILWRFASVIMCGFSGLLMFAWFLWVSDDLADKMWIVWESLSWDQRKVKASEIVRSQRNSAD